MKLIPNLGEVLDRIEDSERQAEVALTANANSLDFLRAVYFDPAQPMHRRMRAAIAALPFETPKLAVVAQIGRGGDFAAQLEAAIKRSGKAMVIDGDWTGSTAPQSADGGMADPESAGDVS